MKREKILRRLIAAAAPFFATVAYGQTINWIGSTTGNYNTPGNWQGNVVPNGGTITANINPASATTVTLDTNPTLLNFTLGNNHQLTATNHSITLAGPTDTINNSGTITLNNSGFSWSSAAVTLTGGGTVVMIGGNLGGFGAGTNGGFSNLNNTIHGSGILGGLSGTFSNSGTLIFDDPSTFNDLAIFAKTAPNSVVNSGTMIALNGHQVHFTTGGLTSYSLNNTGGTLLSTSNTLATITSFTFTNGFTVSGGTIASSGVGAETLVGGGSVVFNGVSFTGFLTDTDSTVLHFSGNNFNAGSMILSGCSFFLDGGTTTMAGAGTIAQISSITGSGTFVNSNAINMATFATLGGGSIAIRNSGTLGVLGGTIKPSAGGLVNTGTLQLGFDSAPATGTLDSSLGTIDSTGGFLQTNNTQVVGTHNNIGTLVIDNGTFNITAGGSATITTMRIAAQSSNTGTLAIAANATATIRAGGGTIGTSYLYALSIAPTGKLDITDHALAILGSSSPDVATIRPLIQQGFAGGWTGTGITSSSAAAQFNSAHKTAVGYMLASEYTATPNAGYTFGGQLFAGNGMLLKYTYAGDTNLDGKVDVTDLGSLASHWQHAGDWFNGDFNYDGTVNVTDLGIIASNWQAGVGSPLAPDSFQQALAEVGLADVFVPEPTILAGLCSSLIFLRRRRLG